MQVINSLIFTLYVCLSVSLHMFLSLCKQQIRVKCDCSPNAGVCTEVFTQHGISQRQQELSQSISKRNKKP